MKDFLFERYFANLMPQTHGFGEKEKIMIFVEDSLGQNSLSRKIHRKLGEVSPLN